MNLTPDAGAGMSKILIVDDSPTQLYSLRQIVEGGGHQTLTAASGEQALELAADENPAVILMDIVMPGMSGYQAKRRLGKTDSTRLRNQQRRRSRPCMGPAPGCQGICHQAGQSSPVVNRYFRGNGSLKS